jgi:hypothetical protein
LIAASNSDATADKFWGSWLGSAEKRSGELAGRRRHADSRSASAACTEAWLLPCAAAAGDAAGSPAACRCASSRSDASSIWTYLKGRRTDWRVVSESSALIQGHTSAQYAGGLQHTTSFATGSCDAAT